MKREGAPSNSNTIRDGARAFPKLSDSEVGAFVRQRFGSSARARTIGGYLGRNCLYRISPNDIILKVFFAPLGSRSALTKQSTELFCYRTLAESQFPLPKLISEDVVAGHPCIIYRFVPGALWQDRTELPDSALDLYFHLGELLATLHRTPERTWRLAPEHMWRYGRKNSIERAVSSAPTNTLIRRAANMLEAISSKGQPSKAALALTHGDLTPRNILIADETTMPRIAAIIDFERARICDPFVDLAMVAFKEFSKGPRVKETILLGYTRDGKLAKTAGRRLKVALLELFVEIAGWASHEDPGYFEQMLKALDQLFSDDDLFKIPPEYLRDGPDGQI